MADHTKIEWTDATWNPVVGCSLVSPGCTNCYAMTLAGTRLQHHPSRAGLTQETKTGPVWTGEVRFVEEWLDQPLRWRRPRRIFVCAHGDLFHENVPDAWIDQVFRVMSMAQRHTFQVLTKRPERMRRYLTDQATRGRIWYEGRAVLPRPNVWLGVSVEDQRRADERIPILLDTPAAVRWVSAEPLLGPINLTEIAVARPDLRASIILDTLRGTGGFHGPPGHLDWVVAGGESGPSARPMHPDWARSLRDQCAAAGVPFHFKQWGSWRTLYERDVDDRDWRECGEVARRDPKGRWLNLAGGHGFHGERLVRVTPVSKAAAGRTLDDVIHDAYPIQKELACPAP